MNIKHASLTNEVWLNEFLIDIALFKRRRNVNGGLDWLYGVLDTNIIERSVQLTQKKQDGYAMWMADEWACRRESDLAGAQVNVP